MGFNAEGHLLTTSAKKPTQQRLLGTQLLLTAKSGKFVQEILAAVRIPPYALFRAIICRVLGSGQGRARFLTMSKKCAAVDMFLCIDTSKTKTKGLLEWWEIPSKTIMII